VSNELEVLMVGNCVMQKADQNPGRFAGEHHEFEAD
jgi:hypothetical protein